MPDFASDALPLTVLIPDNAAIPIEILDQHAALKMAVVTRFGVHALSQDWDSPGIYLLLHRHDAAGMWGVYVGKAPAGIKPRLSSHLRNKEHWYRAVLVRRDTTYGFNSAQVGWLEGRLYEMLMAAEDARLNNSNRPSDETLPPYDRQMLEMVVLPLQRLLRLIGHDPATSDDSAEATTRRTSRFYGITLATLLEAGFVTEGAELVSNNGAWPATAKIGAGGTVLYNEVTYPAPSAAAAAVKGGAANGWEFWAVDDGVKRVTLGSIRAKFLETIGDPQTFFVSSAK